MGILNTSPESFYKKTIVTKKLAISNLVRQMADDDVNFIDVGGMSTAPYLSTYVSEKVESRRIIQAIKTIQRVCNLPISVDTCRASVAIAKSVNISKKNIVFDPAIGFFRKTGTGQFFTKINSDWFERDLLILKNLKSIKMGQPLLVSVSNKSFIGKLLKIENPKDRLFGSVVAEAIAVLNGADIIRTHNVRETKDAVTLVQTLAQKKPRKAYNAS